MKRQWVPGKEVNKKVKEINWWPKTPRKGKAKLFVVVDVSGVNNSMLLLVMLELMLLVVKVVLFVRFLFQTDYLRSNPGLELLLYSLYLYSSKMQTLIQSVNTMTLLFKSIKNHQVALFEVSYVIQYQLSKSIKGVLCTEDFQGCCSIILSALGTPFVLNTLCVQTYVYNP